MRPIRFMQAATRSLQESPKKHRWRPIRRAALVGLLLYGCGSWVLASTLLRNPERVRARDAPEVERVWVTTGDGLSIPLFVVVPEGKPLGLVVLLHPRGGAHPVERMLWLREQGYGSVAPDFRGHGEAPEAQTGFGYFERHEVLAAFDWAQARWPEQPQFVWGTSMGAAAALFALESAGPARGYLLESVYGDLERSFRNRFRMHFPAWLFPLTYGPRAVAQWRSGLPLREIRPIDQLTALPSSRVLLVRGAQDQRVQTDEFEAMHARLPAATAVQWPGLGHVDLFQHAGPDYRAMVLDHLRRWGGDGD